VSQIHVDSREISTAPDPPGHYPDLLEPPGNPRHRTNQGTPSVSAARVLIRTTPGANERLVQLEVTPQSGLAQQVHTLVSGHHRQPNHPQTSVLLRRPSGGSTVATIEERPRRWDAHNSGLVHLKRLVQDQQCDVVLQRRLFKRRMHDNPRHCTDRTADPDLIIPLVLEAVRRRDRHFGVDEGDATLVRRHEVRVLLEEERGRPEEAFAVLQAAAFLGLRRGDGRGRDDHGVATHFQHALALSRLPAIATN
jgi:hypothetical protein